MADSTQATAIPCDHYWSAVASAWIDRRPFRLWREFTDLQQWSLVASWLERSAVAPSRPNQASPATRLLKTDLFDEVAGRGIVHWLLESGLQVTGIDVSKLIVDTAASRNHGIVAVAADVRLLPFADGSFDAIYSGSTLDHFESEDDIHVALRELRRVLRPGGHLLMTMDNAANPIIRLRNGPLLGALRRTRVVPYQVGVTLPPASLETAVTRSGFRVTGMASVMHCPRVLAVACSRLVGLMPRACQRAFLRGLGACEALERLPTRWLTGHYIAVEAVVP